MMGYRSQVVRFSIICIWVMPVMSFRWFTYFKTQIPFHHPQEGSYLSVCCIWRKVCLLSPIYNLQDTRKKKKKKKKEWEKGVRCAAGTKKIKVLWCMFRSRSGWIQTGAEPAGRSNRDGSSWNVREIQCMALHTDPRQVSPTLTEVTKKKKKRTNQSNPKTNKPHTRDIVTSRAIC